ncbi:SMP-30/gluconolactonase/LRE family protein [Rheinheimera sp.]|uniref:SMP-30/gluconolactonase/LRE family protein n=1 Tax=Rheinheimera sp. TaxID=1869214 RepID=UPI00307E06C8
MAELKLIASFQLDNLLGEGVVWHPLSQSLWWTDIHGKALYQLGWPSQQLQKFELDERISCFAHLPENDSLAAEFPLLVAFASGFALYHPVTKARRWLARPELTLPDNRMNDGRVDRQGRFWAGTMVEQDQGQRGTLYCLTAEGAKAVVTDLAIPNALCWSPDSRFIYHGDSPTGQIRRYGFDAASGAVTDGELFAQVPQGEPDGAVIDAQGNLWVALWGGGALARYHASGELMELHSLPVSQPTCLAFGGPELDLIFVTTAHVGFSAEQRAAEPLAGALLVYQSQSKGLPESALQSLHWQKLMAQVEEAANA